ncbi:hypothetical protein Avbf_15892 [Armadillidium vulgare]|nr:hypothetical protein Avbf_15892 [Armadillidium vulgare]
MNIIEDNTMAMEETIMIEDNITVMEEITMIEDSITATEEEMDLIQILVRDNGDKKPEAKHCLLTFKLNNKAAIS